MLSFFRRLNPSGRFVLSRNGGAVAVASVKLNGSKPKVLFCASYPFSGNSEDAWQALARQVPLEKSSSTLVIAPNEYQLLQIDAPSVPQEELKQAVRWKLKDMLPYPVEQATVDVIEIPPDRQNQARGRYLYAVAARNDLIKSYMDYFQAARARLDVIDVPELAQRNIATLLEEEGRGVALVTFNEDGGLLTFTSGGELYHARQIEINAFQLAAADEEQRLRNYERLVLDLQRSLDNFERQFSYVAVTRLVLGPIKGQEEVAAYLRENLYIKVEALNLGDVLDIRAASGLEDQALQSACFVALGAALRSEGDGQ